MSRLQVLYEQILSISVRQLELIQKDEWDNNQADLLIKFLDQRQGIIEQINRIEMKQATITNEEDNLSYSEEMKAARTTILAIRQNDGLCQDMLQKAIKVTGTKLARTRNNKRAYKAYTQNSVNNPWFYDKRR